MVPVGPYTVYVVGGSLDTLRPHEELDDHLGNPLPL